MTFPKLPDALTTGQALANVLNTVNALLNQAEALALSHAPADHGKAAALAAVAHERICQYQAMQHAAANGALFVAMPEETAP